MQDMGEGSCPFEFNFDPTTFKIGDIVSYRVEGPRFGDFPFVGVIKAVFETYIEINPNEPDNPDKTMRATRESRPVVTEEEALK